jgi:nucleotide-binding universal stress UspA family protein
MSQPVVVVAYDGSAAATRALAYAADLAKPDGTVVVVNVIEVSGVGARLETVSAAERARQRQVLREARALLSNRNVAVRVVPAAGDVYAEVLEAAAESDADVIVAGRGKRDARHPLHRPLGLRLARGAGRDVFVAA